MNRCQATAVRWDCCGRGRPRTRCGGACRPDEPCRAPGGARSGEGVTQTRSRLKAQRKGTRKDPTEIELQASRYEQSGPRGIV